ncbi:GNAT family N-acetyltransferase [Camelimonas abortus]|uniref:GNAT family N-acetyltransferase n=1 Tax=Camelimonas abortus TaxID=1017184 RepID=A0ABV7LC00_9HYPH
MAQDRQMVIVRPASDRDAPAILDIFNWAVLETTSVWTETPVTLENRLAMMADRRARGYPFLVAEVDGAVAGYASFGDFRHFDGYAATVEHSVYVAPRFHRRGVGRALMEPLVEAARACGKHVMVGAITADNEASIRLHEAFGFVRVGLMPEVGRKFGRWIDLLLMQKILDGSR